MSPFRLLTRHLTALICLVLAAVPLSAGPARAEATGVTGLTRSQEQIVLRLIDTACGDTWCEGDYAFRFRRLSCEWEERSCTLSLLVAPYSGEVLQWHSRSGELAGPRRYGQLVDGSAGGQQSLRPAFVRSLTTLISSIEATVASAAAPTAAPSA